MQAVWSGGRRPNTLSAIMSNTSRRIAATLYKVIDKISEL